MGSQAMQLSNGAKIVDLVVLPHDIEDQQQDLESSSLSESTLDSTDSSGCQKSTPAVLMLTEKGIGKRVFLSSFRLQARGGIGVMALSLNKGDTLVSAIVVGIDPIKTEVMIASEQGMVTRTSINSVPFYSRAAKGVKLMNLKDGDFVKGMTSTAVQDNLSE